MSGLLRICTAGSVDDGKSTLIGRLLYDSRAIQEDQLAAVERASLRRGVGEIDLSLLTDGLEAEREQGITIDVAYRYFATPRRKFIIADAPGHEQYTRNMATGASTADLAVILVDATKGLLVPLTEVTPAEPGETVETAEVRFRTVGDMTCTCPVESPAASATDIVAETLKVTISERGATRMDDRTSDASMERRKKEGYF